jgi:hypothetical protein
MSRLVLIPQAANEDGLIAGLDDVLGSGLAGQDAAVAPSWPRARWAKREQGKPLSRPDRPHLDLVEPTPA